MADIQNISKAQNPTEKALSAANLAGSGFFASKVYRDEPLLMTAALLEHYTPPKYLEMRRIARDGAQYDSEAKIFYKQGKFMEDFEDEFDYQGTFEKYFPTYQAMNTRQLRGYFSWRAKVRRGVIERTQLSFAFVYIYELLNQIGASSPEDGFYKLKNFRAAYGDIDPKIDGYMGLWLKDYVVYNNLDKSLLEGFSGSDFDSGIPVLLDYKNNDAGAVFSALNSMSSYNMESSRFFKQYPCDVKNVVYDVFDALSEHCEKNLKNSLCERLFGRVYAGSYIMFKSAVFYHQPDRRDFVYEISDVCRYRCENGNWTCERFLGNGKKNQRLGALLKNIDFFMRRKYGFKSALKTDKITKILQDVITGAIDRRLEDKRKAALPKVEIDVAKLQDIRDAALETQNKLTVEAEAGAAEVSNEKVESGQENRAGLSGAEIEFLRCLLRGEAYGDFLKTHGLMLSLLVDSINERLFDVFGDTVIVDLGGGPELLEDYAGALKGIIEE